MLHTYTFRASRRLFQTLADRNTSSRYTLVLEKATTHRDRRVP